MILKKFNEICLKSEIQETKLHNRPPRKIPQDSQIAAPKPYVQIMNCTNCTCNGLFPNTCCISQLRMHPCPPPTSNCGAFSRLVSPSVQGWAFAIPGATPELFWLVFASLSRYKYNIEDFMANTSRFKDWLTCQGQEKLVFLMSMSAFHHCLSSWKSGAIDVNQHIFWLWNEISVDLGFQ